MSKVFFISDLHLGHENMAKKRGFLSADEMNKRIIHNWNSVVHKRDIVWVLGDITMETSKHYHLLSQLNGGINVVLGNHDRPNDIPLLYRYVTKICGMIKYKGFILSHAPIHELEVDRFRANIHGHIHENHILKHSMICDYVGQKDPRYINVSCEVVDYTPILFETILKNYEDSKEK